MTIMRKVLIVEDDRFLASAYKSAFDGICEVLIAYNGIEALQKVKNDKPSLIVLDLLLPLKDGYQVLSELKADVKTRNIPVIVASNLGQASEIERATKLGATAYIIKSETSITDVVSLVKKNCKLT